MLKLPIDASTGHVAIYVGKSGGRVSVLGGNQGDKVQVSNYSAGRVLGYRWPKGVPMPKLQSEKR